MPPCITNSTPPKAGSTTAGTSKTGDGPACLTVELVDGGYGDADGVANGIIVDPLGVVTSTTGDDDPPAASSGGGGGCFIGSVLW